MAHMAYVLLVDWEILPKIPEYDTGSSLFSDIESETLVALGISPTTHVAFFDRLEKLLTRHGCATIYEDHRVLEDCAELLQKSLRGPQGLQTWLNDVPDALKSRRKGGGEAYSTDCSALDIERFAPTWLQRHRLLLELLYHHLSVNLFRPFITFPSGFPKQTSSPSPSTPASASISKSSSFPGASPSPSPSAFMTTNDVATTPLAHQNAHSCARHAIALTSMIREALGSTGHLGGWHEAFQWQWDAAVSLVGFILSDPGSDGIHRDARRAIDHSIEVFDIFGRHFAMATTAARVTRDLAASADRLVERQWQARAGAGGWSGGGSSAEEPRTDTLAFGSNIEGLRLKAGRGVEATGALVDEAMVDEDAVRGLMDGTMNMAYGLDSFGGVDFSLPEAGDVFEGWNYRSTVPAPARP
ncbi:hypothetical protein VMCG_05049 [Cytospora schulzeri]|uniref:Transcription factor domain-containing protein n=1 Tax=Cytospora schulzeri TaxID=448051 RepID=A0A423WLZ9_9PEZI|nr:hypothetical protein VMCG_05049 [Valsa malicola]